ncbi:response regulator [Flavobacterium sp.]|uniref:response regulator n=1 Tax=Flavobacterium sp. TaxID=239 RepID=UPI0025B7C3EB|nr:response regulator [Flavobacterium sp.]MBA4155423.1 response regulator [Flavobacterium sp.]
MKNKDKLKLFLVDDDIVFLKSLEIQFLQHGDFEIETYVTGELCIAALDHEPDVIILDYHLDGIDKKAMNGIETLDIIKESKSHIPVIMLSSQDKIEVAVSCMLHDAFDYIIKSETAFVRIQKDLATLVKLQKMEKELKWYMDKSSFLSH